MTPQQPDPAAIRFAIPKGRMYEGISRLLADAGVRIVQTSRNYRPIVQMPGFTAKILKPRAIIEMLDAGDRDLGFAGADWVADGGADLVEVLDTRLDPVRLVVAAPTSILTGGNLPQRKLVVASEYVNLATQWINDRGLDARLLPSYGATEVLPPEDADCIIDNTATGSTLAANALEIVDEVMTSSTRLYASKAAMENPSKRARIDEFTMLVGAVLEARQRAMLEVNVAKDKVDAIVEALPCMREPTVASLHSGGGYAVKAAVPRTELPRVIPRLRALGGTDIIVTTPEQIVP